VSSMPKDQHNDTITDVCYSENARIFVTGSRDGNVKGFFGFFFYFQLFFKVWDGVSNRCIECFNRAHDGAPICSARFTRNGKVVFLLGLNGGFLKNFFKNNRRLFLQDQELVGF